MSLWICCIGLFVALAVIGWTRLAYLHNFGFALWTLVTGAFQAAFILLMYRPNPKLFGLLLQASPGAGVILSVFVVLCALVERKRPTNRVLAVGFGAFIAFAVLIHCLHPGMMAGLCQDASFVGPTLWMILSFRNTADSSSTGVPSRTVTNLATFCLTSVCTCATTLFGGKIHGAIGNCN